MTDSKYKSAVKIYKSSNCKSGITGLDWVVGPVDHLVGSLLGLSRTIGVPSDVSPCCGLNQKFKRVSYWFVTLTLVSSHGDPTWGNSKIPSGGNKGAKPSGYAGAHVSTPVWKSKFCLKISQVL